MSLTYQQPDAGRQDEKHHRCSPDEADRTTAAKPVCDRCPSIGLLGRSVIGNRAAAIGAHMSWPSLHRSIIRHST